MTKMQSNSTNTKMEKTIYNLQINSVHCLCLDPVSEIHLSPHFHSL